MNKQTIENASSPAPGLLAFPPRMNEFDGSRRPVSVQLAIAPERQHVKPVHTSPRMAGMLGAQQPPPADAPCTATLRTRAAANSPSPHPIMQSKRPRKMVMEPPNR